MPKEHTHQIKESNVFTSLRYLSYDSFSLLRDPVKKEKLSKNVFIGYFGRIGVVSN